MARIVARSWAGKCCLVAACFALFFSPERQQALAATAGSNEGGAYYSYKNLSRLLNQEDKPSDWRQGYRQIAPPAGAVPGPAGESRYNFREPTESDRTFHTFFPWRQAVAPPQAAGPAGYAGYAVNGSAGTTGPGTGQSNPFNLSPFGVLHYLWDPTTYVSSSNPVSLVEVRSDLEVAQQKSALAQSAARRAKYASTPEERQEAARQAQAYAEAARQAAQRASEVAQGGSSNPSDVAALAAEEASRAGAAARQANSSASGWGW